jgi:hypothetical protein
MDFALLASPEPPILLLELGNSLLEVGVVSFAPIARVLCCDAVPVCTGLLALLRGELGA